MIFIYKLGKILAIIFLNPAIDDVRECISYFVDVQVVSCLMRFSYIFWIIAGLVLDKYIVGDAYMQGGNGTMIVLADNKKVKEILSGK